MTTTEFTVFKRDLKKILREIFIGDPFFEEQYSFRASRRVLLKFDVVCGGFVVKFRPVEVEAITATNTLSDYRYRLYIDFLERDFKPDHFANLQRRPKRMLVFNHKPYEPDEVLLYNTIVNTVKEIAPDTKMKGYNG